MDIYRGSVWIAAFSKGAVGFGLYVDGGVARARVFNRGCLAFVLDVLENVQLCPTTLGILPTYPTEIPTRPETTARDCLDNVHFNDAMATAPKHVPTWMPSR